ncbi:MAG TPA: hypothetical protein VKT27_02475 [Candidatus Binataceae bacterium]|nr:hypothetical protein [Candidatus Binataceae bacterium]
MDKERQAEACARPSPNLTAGKILRTRVVLLCAVAIGLGLNLLAAASRRPAPPRGDPITSPALQDIPFV